MQTQHELTAGGATQQPVVAPRSAAFWNRRGHRSEGSRADHIPTVVLLALLVVASSVILTISLLYLACAGGVAVGMWVEGVLSPKRKSPETKSLGLDGGR